MHPPQSHNLTSAFPLEHSSRLLKGETNASNGQPIDGEDSEDVVLSEVELEDSDDDTTVNAMDVEIQLEHDSDEDENPFNPTPKKSFATGIRHEPLDTKKVYASISADQNLSTLDDGTGKLQIWHVYDLKKQEVPENQYGMFYAGDSYLCLYTYEYRGEEMHIIYFWQGTASSMDEKVAVAFMAKEMDDQFEGEPVQVRVVQGSEPLHFLALFKGKMVVYEGGHKSAFRNTEEEDTGLDIVSAVFKVKGSTPLTTKAVQVPVESKSLTNADSFIVLNLQNEKQYIWHGKDSNRTEHDQIEEIAKFLDRSDPVEYNFEHVNQGEEPEEFWEVFGGDKEITEVEDAEINTDSAIDLFLCTRDAQGNLTQLSRLDHIEPETLAKYGKDAKGIILMDCQDEVYIWISENTDEEDKDSAMAAGMAYLKATGKDADTPVIRVTEGKEPPVFNRFFE